MTLQDFKKINLPDTPGVYVFKKKQDPEINSGRQNNGKILYIGKATSLRSRVRSYFSNDLLKTRSVLILDMVTQSDTIDFIETDSVLEALVLEAELIKKHLPIANTKEKDNKSYSFAVITKEDFPQILIERGRALDFDTTKFLAVYGPFPSQTQLQEALKIIRKIFPFRTNANISSLYKQIGLEPDLTSEEAKIKYKKSIRHIRLFLQGKKKAVISLLEKEMQVAAKQERFEDATKMRNQIFALQHIKDVSLLKHDVIKEKGNSVRSAVRIEAYDVAHMSGKNSVGVMTVVEDGEVRKSEYRKFILRKTKRGDDVGGLEEILVRRLKHSEWPLPEIIVLDGGTAQRNKAEQVLKDINISVHLVNVVKNEKHKPERFIGGERVVQDNQRAILLANNEAHRFAIEFYRMKQRKSSLIKATDSKKNK
jgi:excinuclease ABC subunit C